MSYGFQDQFCSAVHVPGAQVHLAFFSECFLAFRRAQVNPGQLEAGEAAILVVKFSHESPHCMVAWVDALSIGITTQRQPDRHDATGDSPTQASSARHTTAETGGDAGDDFRSNIQVLSDRQQDTLGSVEAGAVE